MSHYLSMMNPYMNQINNFNQNNHSRQQKTLIRLKKEFLLCQQDDDLAQIGCTFGLYQEHNLFQWRVTMLGPEDSPYKGGIFTIKIIFPEDYPSHGPEFRFMNKIYHLNVDLKDNEYKGHISLNLLNEWSTIGKVGGKKVYGVKQALFDIFCLFYKQEVWNSYDEEMGKLYLNNREKFNEIARKWTKEYAQLPNEK